MFYLGLDQCAQQDPPVDDLDNLLNLACNKYEYGKLFLQIRRMVIY